MGGSRGCEVVGSGCPLGTPWCPARGLGRGGVVIRLFVWWGGWWLVPVVPAGLSFGVDMGGWDPFGEAVGGDADLPAGVVGSLVVSRAGQEQVGQGGWPAVGPVDPMMYVAPLGWDVAGGEGASAVAEGDGAAEWCGDGAVGAADVQRLAFGAEDSGNDLGVAGHPAGGGRG